MGYLTSSCPILLLRANDLCLAAPRHPRIEMGTLVPQDTVLRDSCPGWVSSSLEVPDYPLRYVSPSAQVSPPTGAVSFGNGVGRAGFCDSAAIERAALVMRKQLVEFGG